MIVFKYLMFYTYLVINIWKFFKNFYENWRFNKISDLNLWYVLFIIYNIDYGPIYIKYTEWFFYLTTLISISKMLIDFKIKSVVWKKIM